MELRVYRADKTLTHVALYGRMDHSGIEGIEAGFLTLTSQLNNACILDLQEVTFMVSIGMRMLIEAAKDLHEHQKELILVGPRGLVLEAMRIAKLDDIFIIVDTTDEAFERLNS